MSRINFEKVVYGVVLVYLIIFVSLLMGCVPTPPTDIPVVDEKPVSLPKLAWDGKHKDAAKWTAHALSEIKSAKSLLSTNISDAAAFCPKFNELTAEQRAVVYLVLLAESVRWESSFNPASSTYECRKTCVYGGGCRYVEGRGYCMLGGHKLDGGLVISRGLMQMSLQSAQYYGCDVSQPSDLNDSYKNISCFVKVAQRFISADKRIGDATASSPWTGLTKYWAVYRGTSDYTRKSLAAIKAATGKAPGCN